MRTSIEHGTGSHLYTTETWPGHTKVATSNPGGPSPQGRTRSVQTSENQRNDRKEDAQLGGSVTSANEKEYVEVQTMA